MISEIFLDGRVRQYIGDVRDALRHIPAEHFDCVVTSPPYWGLRDYGVDGQLGMERSLGEHVSTMVDVFREVKRVLKPTGTLWLNYGDSYATSPNGRSAADIKTLGTSDITYRDKPFSTIGPIHREKRDAKRWGGGNNSDSTLKPKDLCGIPWRVAFGLQDDGWWLRQDIIWSKPNPMPESVQDRCTKAHEYIFLMTKSSQYHFDADAIAEDSKYSNIMGMDGSGFKDPQSFNGKHSQKKMFGDRKEVGGEDDGKRNKRSVWTIATAPFSEAHFATFPPALIEPCILAGCPEGGRVLDPFGGSGTTALVAAQLGRTATLIELNPEYAVLARARIEAAFMGKEEGARHMVQKIGKLDIDPGPLFSTTHVA